MEIFTGTISNENSRNLSVRYFISEGCGFNLRGYFRFGPMLENSTSLKSDISFQTLKINTLYSANVWLAKTSNK